MRKLGLIAGGGRLPIALADHCRRIGRPLFVLRLKGFADAALEPFEGREVGLAELGGGVRALKAAGCQAVCFAGRVSRPDLRAMKPDFRGLAALPGALLAARGGDDGLLTFLLREFEKEGFEVEGAHQVMGELKLPFGPLGRFAPDSDQRADIQRALAVAKEIGRLDIGQGAVVCDGLVLAVEAQEGTDAMLRRVETLPLAIRGTPERRRGVLVKACKPAQEQRIDLPAVGPDTIERAAAAGLAGVAGEAGLILLLDRSEVVAAADRSGLFVVGL
jgi:DUF1009 family protein